MNDKAVFSFAGATKPRIPARNTALFLEPRVRSEGTILGRFSGGGYVVHSETPVLPFKVAPARRSTPIKQDRQAPMALPTGSDITAQQLATRATVSHIKLTSPDTAILKLEVNQGQPAFSFLPGQYAFLQVPGTPHTRALSFACTPNANELTFLIDLRARGVMSDYIRERCAAGDEISLTVPGSSFYLRPLKRAIVMAADGAGLPALLSMLDQIVEGGGTKLPVHLYYSVKQLAGLRELQRIQSYSQRIKNFRFIPVVSTEDKTWIGKTGDLIKHIDLSRSESKGFDVYTCGSSTMVESVTKWLAYDLSCDCTVYSERHQ